MAAAAPKCCFLVSLKRGDTLPGVNSERKETDFSEESEVVWVNDRRTLRSWELWGSGSNPSNEGTWCLVCIVLQRSPMLVSAGCGMLLEATQVSW